MNLLAAFLEVFSGRFQLFSIGKRVTLFGLQCQFDSSKTRKHLLFGFQRRYLWKTSPKTHLITQNKQIRHVCFFPGNIFPGCEGFFFPTTIPKTFKEKKTGPNQSHEFGFGETAVIFTTEPFGLLPGRMYLAEIGSDLRPRGALPGGGMFHWNGGNGENSSPVFFFGGLFLGGTWNCYKLLMVSGWLMLLAGWIGAVGIFGRVFSNFGDVWPICLTMQSSSLTAMASWDLWWIHPAKLLINTSCLRSINCSTRRPFCWQISAFPLTVLLFRWRCCWWLQRKKARMVDGKLQRWKNGSKAFFWRSPGNPSRPLKKLFVNLHRGMFEKHNDKKYNQNTAHPGNFF